MLGRSGRVLIHRRPSRALLCASLAPWSPDHSQYGQAGILSSDGKIAHGDSAQSQGLASPLRRITCLAGAPPHRGRQLAGNHLNERFLTMQTMTTRANGNHPRCTAVTTHSFFCCTLSRTCTLALASRQSRPPGCPHRSVQTQHGLPADGDGGGCAGIGRRRVCIFFFFSPFMCLPVNTSPAIQELRLNKTGHHC